MANSGTEIPTDGVELDPETARLIDEMLADALGRQSLHLKAGFADIGQQLSAGTSKLRAITDEIRADYVHRFYT